MKRVQNYTLGLLLLFLAMAWGSFHPQILALDEAVYTGARELSYSKVWLLACYLVTCLGNGMTVYPLVALWSAWLLYFRRSSQLFLWVAMMTGVFLTNPILKLLFTRSRPVGFASFYSELTSYSFPSGHAVNGVVLFYLLTRMGRMLSVFRCQKGSVEAVSLKPKLWEIIGLVAVGMSRVFLGVHWFSDVVAGVVWGFFISIVGLVVLRKSLSNEI